MLLIVTLAVSVLWVRSYTPADIELAHIQCAASAPTWAADSSLKIMTYNVQFMGSKNYVFFYDIDLSDQDRVDAVARAGRTISSQPSKEHVLWTLDQVAQLIKREDPDIVLLQEINSGADSRTHHVDQLAELLDRVSTDNYPCYSDAPYWQAEYILHPNVLGPVDMRLMTLSKYRITESLRHQLPRKPRNFLVRPFHFQRALLESRIATDDDQTVAVINTHFDAWGAGTGVMEQQVATADALLQELDENNVSWVFGGDLNLLPPDNNRQRTRLHAVGTGIYDEVAQIAPLYEKYRAIPALGDLQSDEPGAWYTHYPNDPTVAGPDRTIDYLFYSDQWSTEEAYVVQGDALQISDHLPLVGILTIAPDTQ